MQALRVVHAQRSLLPRRGLSYGVLRYLGKGRAALLGHVQPPEFAFNYAGQFDNLFGTGALFSMLAEETYFLQSPRAHRGQLLDINAFVLDGSLHADWTYSTALHDRGTVEKLAERFVQALAELAEAVQTTRSQARG